MKKATKILRTVLAGALTLSLCTAFAAPLSASAVIASAPRMGDLDSDYKVSVEDAQGTLMLYVDSLTGNVSGEADQANGAADVDMDGKITASDAQLILQYYCQTLVGNKPLWADIRELSYNDGTNFYQYFATDDDGNPILDAKGQPVLVKPNANRPFELKGMYIEVGCATAKAGDTVNVPVYIAGLPALAGLQLKLVNSAGIKLTDMTSTVRADYEWKSDPLFNTEFDANAGVMVTVQEQGENVAFKDGYVLCTLTYQVPKNAKAGNYTLAVDPTYTKFVTTACESYSFTSLNGIINVEA